MTWILGILALVAAVLWLGERWLRTAPAPMAEAPAEDDLGAVTAEGDSLDLHGVPPREVAECVDAFVEQAVANGTRWVRIVHGKGIGVRRRQVRALLAADPRVVAYGDAPPPSAWGATIAELDGTSGAVEPPATSG